MPSAKRYDSNANRGLPVLMAKWSVLMFSHNRTLVFFGERRRKGHAGLFEKPLCGYDFIDTKGSTI